MRKTCRHPFYDDPEFDYRGYWIRRNYEDLAERQVLRFLYQHIGKQETLVDLGGGYGRLIACYVDWCERAILLEPSLKHLLGVNAEIKKSGKMSFLQSTAEQIALKAESVDVIQMIRVAHHCMDLELVFSQVNRVLKSQGWFIMEFPNKIHALMTAKHWLSGNWKYRKSLKSVDRRSVGQRNNAVIPFMNHHPKYVLSLLESAGFSIEMCLSVSNLRRLNRLPLRLSLRLDRLLWGLAAPVWWGPSIFVLARKK